MKRSVHIDQLRINLSGVEPALAAAVGRLLPAAIERRLRQPQLPAAAESTLRVTAHTDAGQLANRIARQVAAQVQRRSGGQGDAS